MANGSGIASRGTGRKAKSKTHLLFLRVTFDKPCSAKHAAKEAADCIHGEFYPTSLKKSDPDSFRVKSIRPADFKVRP